MGLKIEFLVSLVGNCVYRSINISSASVRKLLRAADRIS